MFEGYDLLQNMAQQIMNTMSFTEANIPCFIAFALVMTGGFLVWVPAVLMCIREKMSPYPIWVHTWWLAGEIIGTISFWYLAFEYNFFWVFTLFGVALPVWIILEIFNIQQGIEHERVEQFQRYYKNEVTKKQALVRVLVMLGIFSVLDLILFVLLGGVENAPLFIYYPFTNFMLALGPLCLWQERAAKGTRDGNSVMLQILIFIEIALTIAPPGIGWWTTVSPAFDNPFYYLFGAVCLVVSGFNFVRLIKLPPKVAREGKKVVW